eukprot:14682117-Ditylum_brightwellii.AAC.1
MKGKPNAHVRKELDEDILRLIKQWQSENTEVALMMDANAGLEEKTLNKIIIEAGMYDLMSAKHRRNTPNIYIYDSKAIELILGTKEVINATKK